MNFSLVASLNNNVGFLLETTTDIILILVLPRLRRDSSFTLLCLQGNLYFPCSHVGSHPQETILLELLQHGSFPWDGILHKLLPVVSQGLPAILLQPGLLTGPQVQSSRHPSVLLWCPAQPSGDLWSNMDSFTCHSSSNSSSHWSFSLSGKTAQKTAAAPWPPASPGTLPWLLSKHSQAQFSMISMISTTALQQAAKAKSGHQQALDSNTR